MPERKAPELLEAAAEFKRALQVLGLSYAEASRKFNVHSRYRVSDFCNGERPIPVDLRAAIGKALDHHLKQRGM